MGDASGWCTIESDPGVFTELIEKIGVKGVQVEELYALEKESLDKLKPVYGLIFLFKYVREEEKRTVLDGGVPGVFFAKQVINNACATQAIVSVLLNREEIQLGGAIKEFADFAVALDPETRGYVLGQSSTIQQAHNSFRRPEPFVMESVEAKEDDDVFHFIGFVPHGGNLYELDGLKRGPILLGECTTENWLDKVTPHIQERIARYSTSEVRFNLMALVRDRREVIADDLKAVQAKKEAATDEGAVAELTSQEEKLKEDLAEEKQKREKWKVENIRRKHNYFPFVFSLLKKLAKEGKLPALQEEAKKKKAKRAEEAKKSKEKEAEKAKQ